MRSSWFSRTPPAAARCALDLQDAIASIDFAAEGLPGHLALRLGAHLGPVFRYHDPIDRRTRLHRLTRQPHRPDRTGHTTGGCIRHRTVCRRARARRPT